MLKVGVSFLDPTPLDIFKDTWGHFKRTLWRTKPASCQQKKQSMIKIEIENQTQRVSQFELIRGFAEKYSPTFILAI